MSDLDDASAVEAVELRAQEQRDEREHGERRMTWRLQLAQLDKLSEPQNRVKGGWHELGPMELIELLNKEARELAAAVVAADWNDSGCVLAVRKECADVANFAAMILDNATSGVWKKADRDVP